LVLNHWAENRKRYGLSVLALIGLLIAWFLFILLMAENRRIPLDAQNLTYFFTLFALGGFYANQQFRDLGSRAKGSNFLLLPASTFEKLLVSLLYAVLLFFIVVTATFYLADILMVTIANSFSLTDDPALKTYVVNVFDFIVLKFTEGFEFNLLVLFFVVQSVFLLGAVHFKKYSFLKTFITGFVSYLLLFSLAFFIYRQLPGGERPDGDVQLPGWVASAFYFVLYTITPFLWIVTYYRLKAKQV
jgi:hypothetical protein